MTLDEKKIYNAPQIHMIEFANYDCIYTSVGSDFIWGDSSLNDDWS